MIFSDSRFWPLFWTQFLGAFNDNFFKNALAILITYRSVTVWGMDSLTVVPLLGGIFILPYFLFSATAGRIADKFQKASLIRLAKVMELAFMSLATVGFFLNNFELLAATLFLMGLQSTFFGPLKYGIIPSLLRPHELLTGNAWVTGGTFSAILLGTLAGGLAAQQDDQTITLGLSLICIALLGLLVSSFIRKVPVHPQNFSIDPNFLRSTIEVLRLTWRQKNIFQTLMGISWFWFFGAAILSLLPLWAKNVVGAQESVSTLFLTTFVLGMGIGPVLAKVFSPERPELGLTPPALFLLGLFLLDIYYILSQFPPPGPELYSLSEFFERPNSARLVVDLLLLSICGGVYIVVQMTYIQERTRSEELSQIIAGNNIWNALFMVSSAGVMAHLNKSLGVVEATLALTLLNLPAVAGMGIIHGKKMLTLIREKKNG